MNNVSKLTVRAVRLGAGALALAGLLFVVYPALRPFSDETSLQGAAAFASNAWVIAHTLGMIGFTLLPVGLLGLLQLFRGTPVEGLSYWALIAALLGVGLTLPYYGGEAFGLQAIGQEAVTRHDPSLVGLADKVRGLPQAAMFTLGLLLIGVSAITVAVAIWRSGTLPKWSGVPFALAFALFIPQFFGTQPIRVAHGLLVAAGCVWLAIVMARSHPLGTG